MDAVTGVGGAAEVASQSLASFRSHMMQENSCKIKPPPDFSANKSKFREAAPDGQSWRADPRVSVPKFRKLLEPSEERKRMADLQVGDEGLRELFDRLFGAEGEERRNT